jgi:hypothetical protein
LETSLGYIVRLYLKKKKKKKKEKEKEKGKGCLLLGDPLIDQTCSVILQGLAQAISPGGLPLMATPSQQSTQQLL